MRLTMVFNAGTAPVERQKYSEIGGFDAAYFVQMGVPPEIAGCLEMCGNFSLSKSSWQTYATADRHVDTCNRELGITLVFPFSVADVLTYIGWLVHRRKVRAKTVQVYLSGLRMAHLRRGFYNTNLRPDIVGQMVTGFKQRDLLHDKLTGRVGRAPITIHLMRVIRSRLRRSGWPMWKKRLVWLVSAFAFNGSFRIHELLSRSSEEFDPTSTLLGEDVKISSSMVGGVLVRSVRVHLKAPKEARLRQGITVDLFPTDSFLCPVVAYLKFLSSSPVSVVPGRPVFRDLGARGYTGRAFNADLQHLLAGQVDYSGGKVTSHSFRAGLATEMARVGYSDADIMTVGRWHSLAFLHYIKSDRLKRMKVGQVLAKTLLTPGSRVQGSAALGL